MGPLIFLLVTCAVVPFGARVLKLCRLAPSPVPERLLASLAVGYVLFGYAVLVLGLFGQLRPWAVAVVWAAAALVGLGHWSLLWEGLLRFLNAILRAFRRRSYFAGTLVVLLIIGLTLVGALAPPAGSDYDGLAEHLAQASYYVRHHVVAPLWHDHHSQFPSNMQMLYSVALLYNHSVSGAKLFHWFHGMLCLIGVALIARRFMARRAAPWAAVILATTPLFIWLCSVSYVDLGAAAYGVLALLMFLHWYRSGERRYLFLSGLLAGCGATVKMQGLALFGVLIFAALLFVLLRWFRKLTDSAPPCPWRPRSLASGLWMVVVTGCLGALICCPWYIRSYLYTGNPVYPFAYSIFGGKHWSADRALGYQRHQLEFGLGELPSQADLDAMPRWQRFFAGPRQPWKWLYAPFGLTYQPWQYEVNLGPLANMVMTSLGPLYLAFMFALLLIPAKPPAVKVTLCLFLALWLWWFSSMQLARYLLPTLALIAPVAGYALYRCLSGGRIIALAAGWAAGLWAVTALILCLLQSLPALPVVLGLQSRDDYLSLNLDIAEPSRFIRENLPTDAKIAMYGEVRSFYFDRDVFWAEMAHSDFFDYTKMRGPQDLLKRYHELGITHVFLNLANLPGMKASQEATVRLLREGMQQGFLIPIADFAHHQNFMLFVVRQPGGQR